MYGRFDAPGRRRKLRLRRELREGSYRFGLLSRLTLQSGEEIDVWSARDALVLKALAIVLGRHLAVSPRCVHVKGHGGAKAAVRQVWQHLPRQRFRPAHRREIVLRLHRPLRAARPARPSGPAIGAC